MNRLADVLGVVFDPRFWVRNCAVDHEWSDYLEALMDAGAPAQWRWGDYTAKIGAHTIWAANWPYAFGRPGWLGSDHMPRRRTALRLAAYLKAAAIEIAEAEQ